MLVEAYLSPATTGTQIPAEIRVSVAAGGPLFRGSREVAVAFARLAPSVGHGQDRVDDMPDGLIGPDGQVLGPPPSPGAEVRLGADTTGVGASCRSMFERFSWKVVRVVVSRNPTYGVVWRADVATPGEVGASTRLICWKAPGGRYMIMSDPLVMFDASQSLSPLSP